ncbi:MAG: hypothetical protein SP1CHLAM54_09470 [Chlamydiia bacterium]|nr:hypothetical protein [Chlamydiia bacterium]MCH9615853.1 hypothetical protein [Chlamydiia bacterium]MCH9628744.1 hypothetical protein [Chlamydiia bacterium]
MRNVSLVFTRVFFTLLSIIFMLVYAIHIPVTPTMKIVIGLSLGVGIMIVLFIIDSLFRRFNLRSFNIAIIGLFIGYLMGLALVLLLDAILSLTDLKTHASDHTIEVIKICFFLGGTYLGTIMTIRSSDELYVSIPFVKFSATGLRKKDLVLDASTVADARIIDLATTGLLDYQLILPRFIIKDLYSQSESSDTHTKQKARRTLETIKKMEESPTLGMRFNDTDFPEVKDLTSKLIRLARLLDANILSSDITRVEMSSIEGVRVINLHAMSNAMKPLMEAGEYITIKVQRYGKEPRQGVGYLDDGTMVVINGGGNYIGETIEAQVLSVKHTSSGRMIFCNALDETEYEETQEEDYTE